MGFKYQYSLVKGYFAHDEPNPADYLTEPEKDIDGGELAPIVRNFGLLPRRYSGEKDEDEAGETDRREAHQRQWARFVRHLSDLNSQAEQADGNTCYKLLFVARHGTGFHNTLRLLDGDERWFGYWARLDNTRQHFAQLEQGETAEPTNVPDNIEIFDPFLTDKGQRQIRHVARLWRENGVPVPDAFYVSPFRRCIHTAWLTFAESADGRPPVRDSLVFGLKEGIRARLGVNTNDRRHSREWISNHFGSPDAPGWAEIHQFDKTADHATVSLQFEPTFPHDPVDQLWHIPARESNSSLETRAHHALDEIIDENAGTDKQIVSLTIHSGSVVSYCKIFGRLGWKKPAEGELMPFLIKVEKIQE